jgi:hypothetical protein
MGSTQQTKCTDQQQHYTSMFAVAGRCGAHGNGRSAKLSHACCYNVPAICMTDPFTVAAVTGVAAAVLLLLGGLFFAYTPVRCVEMQQYDRILKYSKTY